MRRLVVVLGGVLVAGAPFGAHALASQAEQSCSTLPVVNQSVCIPPAGVPGVPNLPPPPSVPIPPAPSLPQVPNLPALPTPNVPTLPPPPALPLPQTPSVPLPPIPNLPSLPGTTTGSGMGTSSTATAPATVAPAAGVCTLPGVAGQVAGQPVATALTGVLGTAGACSGT